VDEDRARAILSHSDIVITVDLNLGLAEATVWTCDFSYDYVRINAAYRT
jgi:glutamate N-acetyltransferase/amino-acid N-acetyltransferase